MDTASSSKTDSSGIMDLLGELAECNRQFNEELGKELAEEESQLEQKKRQFQLLQEHQRIAQEALSKLCINTPLSERVKQKFYSGQASSSLRPKLSDFLSLLDEFAKFLPLYIAEVPFNSQQSGSKSVELTRKQHQRVPPLVGAVPLGESTHVPVGNLVTFLDTRAGETKAQWILAEVVHFNDDCDENGYYTLLDHVAEFNARMGYSSTHCEGKNEKEPLLDGHHLIERVRRRQFIPLPKYRADPRHQPNALFGPGSIVLARFPQSTVFYRGCVLEPPSQSIRNCYRITFNLEADFDLNSYARDADVDVHTIPQLYVVQESDSTRTHKRKSKK